MNTPAPVTVAAVLDRGPWSRAQKVAAALAAGAITLDGLDIQVLGFAVPQIARDWHLPKSSFASLFAVSLLAVAVGSLLGGSLGDRIGRRRSIVASVGWFGVATLLLATAPNLTMLFLWRVLAGLGIGAALPNAAAFIAEVTPARVRTALFSATIVCIPLGGLLGGVLAAHLLPVFSWRVLLAVAGVLPMLLALGLVAALPESPRFLAMLPDRRPQLQAVLRRFGFGEVEETTAVPEPVEASDGGTLPLLGVAYRRNTLLLWGAFACCLFSIYLVFNWLPSMLTTLGLTVRAASNGLAVYNFGGILGSVALGLWMNRSGSRGPMLVACCGSVVTALWLGLHLLTPPDGSALLTLQIGLHGCFTNAVQTALYTLSAHLYPTRLRARGVATAAAFGRGGAVFSAFEGGHAMHGTGQTYFLVLAGMMVAVTLGVSLIGDHVRGTAGERAA